MAQAAEGWARPGLGGPRPLRGQRGPHLRSEGFIFPPHQASCGLSSERGTTASPLGAHPPSVTVGTVPVGNLGSCLFTAFGLQVLQRVWEVGRCQVCTWIAAVLGSHSRQLGVLLLGPVETALFWEAGCEL